MYIYPNKNLTSKRTVIHKLYNTELYNNDHVKKNRELNTLIKK